MRDLATSDDLGLLVRRFYATVREDDLLGPVFAARISDWDEHLDTMRRFWSHVMLGLPLYHGAPVAAHHDLPIHDVHFARWLALWRATVAACFDGPLATAIVERAARIGQGLARRVAEAV